MADFNFRWREPGTDGMNAAGTVSNAGSAFDAFTRAAESNGANTFEQVSELDTEIEQIRRKIASLEIEREQLEKGRVSRDELDRKLAANRAMVSDFGTARAHWSDIDNRKRETEAWNRQEAMRASDEKRAARNAIEQLKNDIDKQNTLLAWGTDNRAFAADEQLYHRLVDKLLKEYGVDYDPRATVQNGGTGANVPGVPNTDEGWRIFETQFKDKDGNWLSEDLKRFYLQNRPQNTAEAAEAAKRVQNERTAAEAAKASANVREKESEAISEIMLTRGAFSAGKSFRATNDLTVSIEKLPGGGVRYRCGKSYRDLR